MGGGASPKIIKFGFKDGYLVDDTRKKRTAVCKVCSSKLSHANDFIKQKAQTKARECVGYVNGT